MYVVIKRLEYVLKWAFTGPLKSFVIRQNITKLGSLYYFSQISEALLKTR